MEITAKIVPVEVLKKGVKWACNVTISDCDIVYQIHGFRGDDKVVHGLNTYSCTPNELEEKRIEFEKKWNSAGWQKNNRTASFMRRIVPKSIRWKMMGLK